MVDFKMVHNLSKDFNILYVENNEEIRTKTEEIFKKYFASVDIAVDGDDALKKYNDYYRKNKQYYDLLISSIVMPNLNGIELSNSIMEIHDEQPIIILSASLEPMYLFELFNLGISNFISKPISLAHVNRVFYHTFQAISKRQTELERREYEKIEREFLMGILHLQDNFIITTDGRKIRSANQSLLNFFDFKTVEGFNAAYTCICHTFMKIDGYFHSGVLQENELWVDHILAQKDKDTMVMMQNPKTQENESFKVTVNYFHDTNKYIVTFANITKIALQSKLNHKKAMYDDLTGIYNRNKLNELLQHLFSSTKKQNFAFILFDIDHFKKINDTYGHLEGDKVLKHLTGIVKANIRDNDVFIRWGGDEFILIIENINSSQSAMKVAEHLRHTIQENLFPNIPKLTCSFGVSIHRDGDTLDQIINRVDQALYNAKRDGRNAIKFI